MSVLPRLSARGRDGQRLPSPMERAATHREAEQRAAAAEVELARVREELRRLREGRS